MNVVPVKKICENVGDKLYEKEKAEAEYLYNNQHKVLSDIPGREKKGRLYIELDGSFVSIRGRGWKEVRLGEVFKDTKIINKGNERHIIVEKDYTAVIGSAEEFKKFLWTCVVRDGLGGELSRILCLIKVA